VRIKEKERNRKFPSPPMDFTDVGTLQDHKWGRGSFSSSREKGGREGGREGGRGRREGERYQVDHREGELVPRPSDLSCD
jgi:hypothetical protein